jgi:hypothetical protein
MADRMFPGTRKAVTPLILLALAGLVAAGCGSSADDTTTAQPPPVSASTADHLARLSERIASDLDEGATCDAAIAADDLKTAVDGADLAATLRPGVEQVASDLVDAVNCPPPPEPEPKKEKKKPEEHKDEHGQDEKSGPGHSGGVPPGHAKLKGEDG